MTAAGTHRHQWTIVGFAFEDDRPLMQQRCVDCGQERAIPAWDRTWTPSADERPVQRRSS